MVETGTLNDNEIIVRRGITKDDRVLLAPPTDKTDIKTVTIPGLKPATPQNTTGDTAKSVSLPATPPPAVPGKKD
jgi:hypothetical protein